ncbi:MAG: hypothetical protein KatS3mg010_1128 [Acidimicrobiia bacterium]|nr:MAG: hypothetical protein KatS3mg010_1128 [Acidimicrobiia bacterium]
MIQEVYPFVVTNQLDEPVWREFLAVPDVEANVFHTPEMVRVFDSAARHRALPWAALDGRGRVRALLVPVEVTMRQGAMRFLTSRSVVYGGIARTVDEAGSEAAAALLETYAASASRVTLFTEIRHLSDPAPLRHALAAAGFRHEDHLNYLIPLADLGRDPWRGLTRGRAQARDAGRAEGRHRDRGDLAGRDRRCLPAPRGRLPARSGAAREPLAVRSRGRRTGPARPATRVRRTTAR